MDTFPQLRILHLSDLHFHASSSDSNHICTPGDATAAREGYPTLLELLLQDLNSEDWKEFPWAVRSANTKVESPRLIVAATGDFAHTANPTEFDHALGLLTGLTDKAILDTKLSLKDIFVVPGNHDVVFDKHEPAHRFQSYCSFYNDLFAPLQPDTREFVRPADAKKLSKVHLFRDNRFLVAEINSSYYVEKETIDESRGQVDMAAIASLRQQLDAAARESKDWIKIALVHHHPVLLPSFVEAGRGVDAILNARSLLSLLRKHGFQLILHGHKHFPQVFSYDPDPAWKSTEAAASQLIVAGGSAGSISLPDGKQRSNTYNLITVKWIPQTLQARVQIVTRGLNRMDDDHGLDPDQWKWQTLRVYDKVLSPYLNFPSPNNFKRVKFPDDADQIEEQRKAEYARLRFNMPVVEVFPSLLPGQGYEARVWLERHRHHRESPKQVVWSAGRMFDRKICDASAAPDFCGSFHYWGPMLIQGELTFEDGTAVTAYAYARLSDAITRR